MEPNIEDITSLGGQADPHLGMNESNELTDEQLMVVAGGIRAIGLVTIDK